MNLKPIETAPKAPLDGLRHGPTVLLHVVGYEPIEAWWSEHRKGWSTPAGRLLLAPIGWTALEPKAARSDLGTAPNKVVSLWEHVRTFASRSPKAKLAQQAPTTSTQ